MLLEISGEVTPERIKGWSQRIKGWSQRIKGWSQRIKGWIQSHNLVVDGTGDRSKV